MLFNDLLELLNFFVPFVDLVCHAEDMGAGLVVICDQVLDVFMSLVQLLLMLLVLLVQLCHLLLHILYLLLLAQESARHTRVDAPKQPRQCYVVGINLNDLMESV